MALGVRDLVDADLDAVATMRFAWRLERHPDGGEPFEAFLEGLRSWWARSRHVGVVADLDGSVVGMGFLAVVGRVPWPDEAVRASADVQSLYVEPAHRGRGVGAALLAGLVARAWALGCTRVTVNSASGAVGFYLQAGFERSDRLFVLDRP